MLAAADVNLLGTACTTGVFSAKFVLPRGWTGVRDPEVGVIGEVSGG